jgi:hypothetical protein
LDLAIRSLLSVVSHRPGTKHVVVLAGTAEDCHELAGTYRALAEQARNLNTSIHAVASPTLPATAYALLQKLAHESGGRALRAPSTDVLGDTLTTLYLSLVHHYRIVCLRKDESQTPSRILVRVQSSNASGYHEIDNLEGLDRLPAKEQLAPLATS